MTPQPQHITSSHKIKFIHSGSSSWITDANGAVNQHLQYLPFGEDFIYQRNSSWDVPYTFSGKEKDSETGYSYFGARFPIAIGSSELSVWLSVDPMSGMYPSMSPYMYVAGNPVVLVDEDGFWPKPFKVKMDDGKKVWVITHTRNAQKVWFFGWQSGIKFFNFAHDKDKPSLLLLERQRSGESINESADLRKIHETFSGYNITSILVNLVDQHENVDLYIIGNHEVPHENYLGGIHSNNSYYLGKINKNNKHKPELFITGEEVYIDKNGTKGTYNNRTVDMDSEWSRERAEHIRKTLFDDSQRIKVVSRNDVNSQFLKGTKLEKFGFDPMGVTIGIKTYRKSRVSHDRHKTVLFL